MCEGRWAWRHLQRVPVELEVVYWQRMRPEVEPRWYPNYNEVSFLPTTGWRGQWHTPCHTHSNTHIWWLLPVSWQWQMMVQALGRKSSLWQKFANLAYVSILALSVSSIMKANTVRSLSKELGQPAESFNGRSEAVTRLTEGHRVYRVAGLLWMYLNSDMNWSAAVALKLNCWNGNVGPSLVDAWFVWAPLFNNSNFS